MKIDLRKCKKGDILISSHGAILEYLHPVKHGEYLDHKVKYLIVDGVKQGKYCFGSRTSDGFVFRNCRKPDIDHDIVKIIKKEDYKPSKINKS